MCDSSLFTENSQLRPLENPLFWRKAIAEAKDFVARASECDFDINIFYNRVIIDAKSILGVLSLDFTKVLTVEFSGENPGFEEFLDDHDAAKVHAVA